VRLNIPFWLILVRFYHILIRNACGRALHPAGCAEITQIVLFPNRLWFSNDPRAAAPLQEAPTALALQGGEAVSQSTQAA